MKQLLTKIALLILTSAVWSQAQATYVTDLATYVSSPTFELSADSCTVFRQNESGYEVLKVPVTGSLSHSILEADPVNCAYMMTYDILLSKVALVESYKDIYESGNGQDQPMFVTIERSYNWYRKARNLLLQNSAHIKHKGKSANAFTSCSVQSRSKKFSPRQVITRDEHMQIIELGKSYRKTDDSALQRELIEEARGAIRRMVDERVVIDCN